MESLSVFDVIQVLAFPLLKAQNTTFHIIGIEAKGILLLLLLIRLHY